MAKEKNLLFVIAAGTGLLLAGAGAVIVDGNFGIVSIILLALGAAVSGFYAFVKRNELLAILSSRSARHGANIAVYALLFTAVIFIIQALFTVNSKQIDLSKSGKYTLSEQTLKIVKNLKADVEIYYFFGKQFKDVAMEDTLKLYEKSSSKVKFQSVDVDSNPTVAKKFEVNRYGVVVLAEKGGVKRQLVDKLSEEGVTNGLIRLAAGRKKKVYFTAGHGEMEINAQANEKNSISGIKGSLEAQNFGVERLELLSAQGVPADCSLLVIAGPAVDFTSPETAMLKKYIGSGGRVIAMYLPYSRLPNIESLLGDFGITPLNNIVVDKINTLYGGSDPVMPAASIYEVHPVTEGMMNIATMYPQTRSFMMDSNAKPGKRVVPLVKTHALTWGETDFNSLVDGKMKKDPADLGGPLTVVAMVETDNAVYEMAPQYGEVKGTKSMIAAVGSAYLINNTYLDSMGNRDFFLNLAGYMAGEEGSIAIRPREADFEPLNATKNELQRVTRIVYIIIPALCALVGTIIIIIRRKRT